MKKILIATLIACTLSSTVFCQNSVSTVYVELASKGAVYTVNYDRIFCKGKKILYSGRIGFSVERDAVSFPLGLSAITGRGQHHAEFAFAAVPYIDHYKTFLRSNDLSDKYLFLIPSAGYRFQKPEGGFFFRAYAAPFLFLDPPSNDFWNMDPRLYGMVAAALGFSF